MPFEKPQEAGREQYSEAEIAGKDFLALLKAGAKLPEPLRQELLTALFSARRNEGGDVETSGEIWDKFVTKVARAEHDLLRPEDKALIAEIIHQMKDALVAFRVSQTKPVGATKAAIQEDYSAFDIISGNFSELDTRVIGALSPDVRLGFANRASANHAVIFPHPQDANLVVVYSVLNTPQRTSQADSRTIDHKYCLVLRRGAWIGLLEQQGLRVFSFILSGLGMEIAPSGREVFFDGSFAGQQAVYGKGENQMAIIDVAHRRISSVKDTSKPDAPTVSQYSSDSDFGKGIKLARGDSFSPEVFSLLGPRLGPPKKSSYERNS